MRISNYRQMMARWLLAVFIPLLALSSLHVHETYGQAGVTCVDCLHHVHHNGHFSSPALCLDHCLLCQLHHLPFLAPAVLSVAVFRRLAGRRPVMAFQGCPSLCVGQPVGRAPPAGSVS